MSYLRWMMFNARSHEILATLNRDMAHGWHSELASSAQSLIAIQLNLKVS